MGNILTPNVLQKLKKQKENCIEDFTPERISNLKQQIKKAYKPGIGICATTLSRILFGYQQAIYKYEGVAYHFFNLVATRSVLNRSRKGSLFFVYKDDIGKTAFPVCRSDWHDLAPKVTETPAELFMQLATIFQKLSILFNQKDGNNNNIMCEWFQDNKCNIDRPASIYPCIANGNMTKCPFEIVENSQGI